MSTIQNEMGSRFVAKRVLETPDSHRVKMISLARQMKDVISLGRGDPDLETPPHIIAAAKEALDLGKPSTHYTPWIGIPELRKAIADDYQSRTGHVVNPDKNVMVTTGAQEAIAITLFTLLNPGEEIIVPEPRYTPYDTLVEMAGGKIVSLPTDMENDFQIDPEKLDKLITPRTKALLLISPNNPTGCILSRESLRQVMEIANKRDILVIFDEIYGGIIFDNVDYCNIAVFPEVRDRVITIGGISKTYSMTGWRIGYLIAPEFICSKMLDIKYSFTICAPALSQQAAVAALTGPQDCVRETTKIYDERRRLAMKWLDKLGMDYCEPGGSFYIYPNIEKYGMTSLELAMLILRKANVLVFPGTAFGEAAEGHLRISLLSPAEQIDEAFKRIEKLLVEL
ncbi:MAG: pyridoxal phosphate-dependent aminotransferase [Firmicutes bacterium]|nr:pyridoxal phosphate-dependent aminotransferase [Bacillota bacterium]